MAFNTDKNSYTIIFSVIMVIVVGSILAGLASGLKEKVTSNEKREKQQNILYALGVNDNEGGSDVTFISENVEDKFKEIVKKQYVIQGDSVIEDSLAYLIDIKKEKTKAKNDPDYKQRLPLLVGEKDGKEVYVMPVRGKGLWDAIWGFVAVDKTMTIQGVYYDHKGETPGLGAEIKQRYFMDDFTGESFLNGDAFKGIDVSKSNNDPNNTDTSDNEVDALAGATITGDGVTAMLKKDVRQYVPYFKGLK